MDLVRQRIVFENLSDLCACIEAIHLDRELEIVRMKNRFDLGYDGLVTAGYRDVVMTLRATTEATRSQGLSGHTVELQLAHKQMAFCSAPRSTKGI